MTPHHWDADNHCAEPDCWASLTFGRELPCPASLDAVRPLWRAASLHRRDGSVLEPPADVADDCRACHGEGAVPARPGSHEYATGSCDRTTCTDCHGDGRRRATEEP